MSNVEIGIASILAILVLIQLGMHVAIALMTVSFFGVFLVKGKFLIAGKLLSHAALDGVARYSFGVIPLFVLMGVLVGACGMGRDVFDVAGQLFRRFRGGLGIATVFANAVFAAVNGTSIASASSSGAFSCAAYATHASTAARAASVPSILFVGVVVALSVISANGPTISLLWMATLKRKAKDST